MIGITQILNVRTSRKILASRLTQDMETKITFLALKVCCPFIWSLEIIFTYFFAKSGQLLTLLFFLYFKDFLFGFHYFQYILNMLSDSLNMFALQRKLNLY